MDLGFTGTQAEVTRKQQTALRTLFRRLYDGGFRTLHSGDCISADELAHRIWKEIGGRSHGHPPDVDAKRAFCKFDLMDPALPYLDRNQAIVDQSRLIVATPKEKEPQLRSGTWATLRRAVNARKPIFIIEPSGSVRRTYGP